MTERVKSQLEEWVAEWDAELATHKELARRHAAYGGDLYLVHATTYKIIERMLESWRRRSATD